MSPLFLYAYFMFLNTHISDAHSVDSAARNLLLKDS